MSSNKKDSNQKSILNFFNSSCGVSGNKRNFKEMTDGQANLDLTQNSNQSSKLIKAPLNNSETKSNQTAQKSLNPFSNSENKDKDIDGLFVTAKKKKIVNDDDDDNDNFDTPKFKNPNPSSTNNNFKSNVNSCVIEIDSFSDVKNNIQNKTNPVFKSRTNKTIEEDILNCSDIPVREKIIKTETKKSTKFDLDEEDEDDNGLDEDAQAGNMMLNSFSNPYLGLPEFLKAENIKDKMGRYPADPDYDPTTLLVPNTFLKSKQCTPAMHQFWQFKQDNFDKVLLFKLGKFYELFYDDAIVGNQVLDLNWMGNDPKKLHVGFPEKCLEEKAQKLIDAGFKVAVVEQIERPEDLRERAKTSGVKDKIVKRELCNVFTKGTYLNTNNANNLNYPNKFCITLVCNYKSSGSRLSSKIQTQTYSQTSTSNNDNSDIYEWGFVIFDVTTLKFYVGSISEEEKSFNKILTLLYNIRPEEVILMRNNIPQYILNFIQTLSSKPQLTYLRNDYNVITFNKQCTQYFGDNLENWDKIILKHISDEESNRNLCCALYVTINFLEKILLADQCLKLGNFEEYENPSKLINNPRLILDYQAITNLELIETKLDPKNPEAGSLLEYMNRANTKFGKRMFKTWLLNPLSRINEINERLDMVEDFTNNSDLLNSFKNQLSKWPDIERNCSKIYKYAIGNTKAVYFEDVSKNRLQDFFNVVNFLKKSVDIFKLFEPFKNNFRSEKFIQKINYKDDGSGNVPNIKEELEIFSKNFIIKTIVDDNNANVLIVEPNEGIYEEYDSYKNEITNIEQEFLEILRNEKTRLNCAVITFTHTKFYKYELEVPEEYVVGNKRPKQYKLTTSRKGFLRFHTDEILDLVSKLESLQLKLKDETRKLNIILFKEFYIKSPILNEYIKNIAELDCLAALAIVSTESEGVMTRPKFITLEENNGLPYLNLEKSRHPCLSTRTHSFVSNDIKIGDNNKTAIVITGPNMGGKSTLLRQACICAVMAHMGCYVPAEKCVMTGVDRIFTRIGAKDKILEGKSTFYIEMEETKTIMSHATINSLVIMDELGRGTSTHDGMIIAKTILDRLEKRMKCRTLFTTHYHGLKDWCRIQPGIGLYFMDCVVNENIKDIAFLYKFREGVCPQSYGIHVAKLAGLPHSIIELAGEISENFRKTRTIFNN